MFDFSRATFRYDPFPVGVATQVFEPNVYEALVKTYPGEGIFRQLTGAYNKWSLSERNNPDAYINFVKGSPPWTEVYRHIKSLKFSVPLLEALKQAGLSIPPGPYTARFEFSSLPADGGGIEAHTDIPSKVLTLIIPIVSPGDWNERWGGGTDMLRPLDPWRRYVDYGEPRKNFETVQTYAYAPNQAVIFIKTFNSWHAVGPILGPPERWRRTLTVNMEHM